MIKRRLRIPGIAVFLMAVSPFLAYAGQSFNLTAGLKTQFTIPNRAPYNNLGDQRIEFRFHDYAACSSSYENIWHFGALQIRCMQNGRINVTDWGTSQAVSVDPSDMKDFLLRIQHNVSEGSLQAEIWRIDGSDHKLSVNDKASTAPRNSSGTRSVGDTSGTVKIAWARWYSTCVPTGGAPPSGLPGGDLGDWEFEGNGLDTSGNGLNININATTASYEPTPVYSPAAIIRVPGSPGWMGRTSVAADSATQLDGSASLAFTDGPLASYHWEEFSGPTTLQWSDKDTSQPVVSGFAPGEYWIELTVTDLLGQTDTTYRVMAAVATDAKGVVQQYDPAVDLVFGPLTPLGSSPWPYLDEKHQALADYFGGSLNTASDLQDEWNQALAGVVHVQMGSSLVEGDGTEFQTDFCGGEGNTAPTGARLVIWYPLGDDQTGRRAYFVESCDSQTQLSLSEQYRAVESASGLHYAKLSCAGCWVNGSNNVNYYDNVLAFYSLYYRTGLIDYLNYARTLADRWWTQPWIDEGRVCWFGGDYAAKCPPPRVRALAGLIWRAHEGRPDMWPALRKFIDLSKTGGSTGIGDVREAGYNLAYVSLASMLDPDEDKRNEYREDTLNSITNRWLANQQAEGNWVQWGWGYTNGWCGRVTVTNGSTTVVGEDTSGCWPANLTKPQMYFVRSGDSVAYKVVGGDATKLVLDRPYEGTTASGAGYQMNNLVGYGTQPFIMGVALQGMYFAWRATGSDAAKKMLLDGVKWIRTVGVQPSTRGLYYARGFLNCEPNPDDVGNCAAEVGGARLFSGEVIGAFARAYLAEPDPEILQAGDNLVSAALGKLGGPGSDSNYAAELDWATTYDKEKDFGFFFGFGAAPAWLGARGAASQ